MRRVMPLAKKIIIIIYVLLIALMNISAVVAGVRAEIRRKPVSYYGTGYCSIFSDSPAYSGTITKVETWSFPEHHYTITRIKVKNIEGERWFYHDSRPMGEIDFERLLGNEVTFTYYDEDKIESVLKYEVPPRVRVFNITLQTLLAFLIPDILLAVLFVLIYRIVYRAQRREKVIVPVIALCAYLLVLGGLYFYYVTHTTQIAEAPAGVTVIHHPEDLMSESIPDSLLRINMIIGEKDGNNV